MLIEIKAGERTLYDALKEKKQQVETHCGTGMCGFCRTKLIHGTVYYSEPPIAYIAEGEVLICCGKAQTNVVLELSH